MGRHSAKNQGSIVESFKKARCQPEVQIDVDTQSKNPLCQDILDSLKQEFNQYKSAIQLAQKSGGRNQRDAEHDCQEKANRLLPIINRSISQGIGGGKVMVEMLVQILSDQNIHKCVKACTDSFMMLKILLFGGEYWNVQQSRLQGMDMYDFLVSCAGTVLEIQKGRASPADHLGQLLLFQYLVLILKEDVQQRRIGLGSTPESIKTCQLFRTFQLSIGANHTFSHFIMQLFQIISFQYEQLYYNNLCKLFVDAVLACWDFLRFIIQFLNLCENQGLFYKHSNCRINFRMQIDQVLVEKVMSSEDFLDIHKRRVVLSCLDSQDRVRFWGLFICRCLLKNNPNTRTIDAFSKAYYFYNNPTELSTLFSILKPLEMLKYISSSKGFRFCMKNLFENQRKKDGEADNVAWLVVDVVHSSLDLELGVHREIIELLDCIIKLMKESTSERNLHGIKQLSKCSTQLSVAMDFAQQGR
eukprot:TRINITY_DN20511_c0_g1_i6.p1 TRINITY_DN20511_c0_g1~~TRINITY_DN20511_c0_g1_i6.p1  ORF type:complete len:471 (+),score=21.33 TRINITY_DN20511_c0_g1_i6:230-1642(+)